jgi:hypothetical protein
MLDRPSLVGFEPHQFFLCVALSACEFLETAWRDLDQARPRPGVQRDQQRAPQLGQSGKGIAFGHECVAL